MRENRALSYLVLTIVYAIAVLVGWAAYVWLPFSFWVNLLLADVLATIATFVFSVVFHNASVYDPYWSVQPIVIGVGFAVTGKATMAGFMLLGVVLIWGIRLTANWAYTFHGMDHQDWRYTMLKEKTGTFYPIINFVGIHMVPTLVVYACVLPLVFVLYYGAQINALSVAFAALSLLAVGLQGTSDIQMHRFRKAKSEGKVEGFIRVGFWKYARHPNYLGEIVMWWGIGLAALSLMPDRWYLLAGAVANTLLFLFVSIPLAEGKQSKKEGYEEYKRQTRALLPIIKR
jgi:steroid 5-alpha reductase family enzyme